MPETAAMSPADFRAWLDHMGLSQREAVDVLGISRPTIAKCLREGASLTVALACAALAAGLGPWRPEMTIMTRATLAVLNGRHTAIFDAYDGDAYDLRERLGVWLTDEVGPYASTGTPADKALADAYGTDYVCALDTGECVVWGPEEGEHGVTCRRLIIASA